METCVITLEKPKRDILNETLLEQVFKTPIIHMQFVKRLKLLKA